LYLIIGKKGKNPQRLHEQEEEREREREEGGEEEGAKEGEQSEPKKRSLYKYIISFFDFHFLIFIF